jgi:hypothetical protein
MNEITMKQCEDFAKNKIDNIGIVIIIEETEKIIIKRTGKLFSICNTSIYGTGFISNFKLEDVVDYIYTYRDYIINEKCFNIGNGKHKLSFD